MTTSGWYGWPVSRSRIQWVRGEQQLLPGLARRAGCELVHSLASTAPLRGRFARIATVEEALEAVELKLAS